MDGTWKWKLSAHLFDISGKCVCVTGASSGLGRAAATFLAESGACVVGVARRADKLADWQARTNGETAALQGDLGDLARIADLAKTIAEPFGTPDILINAAGLNKRVCASDTTLSAWSETLDLNLSAPFFFWRKP